jgi:AraC-like DNA-binding protein
LQLVEMVKRWGVTADELLSGSGLSQDLVADPEARISLQTMAFVTERARALTGEPGLGYYLGLQKRASMYGYLGFAAMSARTLREALELTIEFTHVVTTSLDLRLKVDGEVAALVIEEHVDIGSSRDVGLLSLLVGLSTIAATLTGRKIKGSADVSLPEPPYYPRFAHLLPNVRFGQPKTQILFEAASLDLPLVAPDPAGLELARRQCERELQALGFDGDILGHVRRALPGAAGFRTVGEVAAELHLSTRTLKRRLAARGVSFSTLLDQERCERAVMMLRSSGDTLDAIAERLGYATVSNFGRAFRRCTGRTPAAFRREAESAPGSPGAGGSG